MNANEVLTKALGIICDDDIALDVESKKRQRLLDSLNMIYAELTDEYVDLRKNETMTVENGRIYYADFAESVKNILSIKQNGASREFKIYPIYAGVSAEGECDVEYTYHGGELTLTSDIVLPPQYTAAILATGVASEYFYRSGLPEEAIFYKTRYDNSVMNISRRRNPITIRERRFI